MGQMKETLHDTPELEAYQDHNDRMAAINALAADLFNEIRSVEFTLRVLHDSVMEFYKELNK